MRRGGCGCLGAGPRFLCCSGLAGNLAIAWSSSSPMAGSGSSGSLKTLGVNTRRIKDWVVIRKV